MDLARRTNRVCYRVAQHSMGSPPSLAHVRVAEQHRSQQQKRRAQSHAIYRAANCVNESRDTSAVDRGTVVGVWFARWRALSGDRNHLSGYACRVSPVARQKLLPRACVMLFAAGGVAAERVFVARFKWLEPVLLGVIIVTGALFAPFALPILPPAKLIAYMQAIGLQPPRTETSHTAALPQVFADQFGWEQMAGSVAHVYHHLRPDDEKRAAIFCQNYGEAGAIDFFGPKVGLPPAISGHQNYFLWGPRDWTGEVVLVLDTNDEDERELFASVQDLGQIVSSPWAMPFERRMHIFLCRDLKTSVQEFWPRVKKWL